MSFAKRLLLAIVLFGLAVSLYNTLGTVNAQTGEPNTIIDAAFKDLSQRLGRTLNRDTNAFSWDQILFPDTSLGCPAPNTAAGQIVTKGYKIVITDKGTQYDYRATLSGDVLFQCTPNGPAPAFGTAATQAASGGVTATPGIVPPIANPTATGPIQPISYNNPLAYRGNDGNIYITSLGSGNGTALTADGHPLGGPQSRYYMNPQWSPDGSALLYSEFYSDNIYLAQSGQAPAQIATNIAPGNPPAWSPDGKDIAYAIASNQPAPGSSSASVTIQIQAYPVAGGTPRVVATFAQDEGCGGGDVDAADGLYYVETGSGGNFLSLVWTTQGFVYSTQCSGVGLGMIDPTGQIKWQNAKLRRLAVSADRKRGAALDDKGLVIIDFATGTTTPILTDPTIDQVAWGAGDTSILYSTVTPLPPVKGDPAKASVGNQIIQVWPYDGPNYKVSLFRIPDVGGQTTPLFSQEGRGIGVITAVPKSDNILFSFITSTAALITKINAGATVAQARIAYPTIDLYSITPGGTAVKLVSGGRPVLSSAAAFNVTPALSATTGVTCPGFLPSRLIVGQKGRVTPGNANRLRAEPGTGTILGTIPPGGVFTVLSGPTCTSNGIAWWQVTYNSLTGWTGEGQNNAYWVEPVGLGN